MEQKFNFHLFSKHPSIKKIPPNLPFTRFSFSASLLTVMPEREEYLFSAESKKLCQIDVPNISQSQAQARHNCAKIHTLKFLLYYLLFLLYTELFESTPGIRIQIRPKSWFRIQCICTTLDENINFFKQAAIYCKNRLHLNRLI